uniref:Uncharacterized protein n=1 Tax=Hucho hucho TaxID=62062 RepID=A0A4W5PKE1_9TELE
SGASPEYSKTELAGVPCKLFVTLIWTNYTIQSELFVVDPYVFILPTCANKSTGRFERAFVTLGGCCITREILFLQRLELSNGLRMGLSETKDMAWILNLVTRQGATWANILESVGECLVFGDDVNTVVAGTMTGMLYKSTGYNILYMTSEFRFSA